MLKDKVVSVLKINGKSVQSLAENEGLSRQTWYYKLRNTSLSARDLAKVAEYAGGKLTIVTPNLSIDIKVDDFIDKEDRRKLAPNGFQKS